MGLWTVLLCLPISFAATVHMYICKKCLADVVRVDPALAGALRPATSFKNHQD